MALPMLGRCKMSPITRDWSPVMVLTSSRVGAKDAKLDGATVGGAVALGAAMCAGAPEGCTPHTIKTPATTMITAYDSAVPARARSRPRWPVRRIWRRLTCPRTAPTGAIRNANTTDKVARALTGWRSGGGAVGVEYAGAAAGLLPNGVSPNGLCWNGF